MSAVRSRGWAVWSAAVVGNAVVQAATVVPFATPSASAGFVLLATASGASLVAALALVVVALRPVTAGSRRWVPRWGDWVVSLAVVLAVSLAAIASPWLLPVALLLAAVLLSGAAAGDRSAGFTAVRLAPARAAGLGLLTLAAVGLLWLGALLLGFFITGWPAAGLTWLAFGIVAVPLLSAWTSLARRHPAQPRQPGGHTLPE